MQVEVRIDELEFLWWKFTEVHPADSFGRIQVVTDIIKFIVFDGSIVPLCYSLLKMIISGSATIPEER